MSLVKSSGNKPEKVLETLLKRAGIPFLLYRGDLPGTPDFVLKRAKVAVFVDGEFWHGRHFDQWKRNLRAYWLRKIGRNMARDRRVSRLLRSRGFSVVRIWEPDVMKRPEWCLARIARAIRRFRLNSAE